MGLVWTIDRGELEEAIAQNDVEFLWDVCQELERAREVVDAAREFVDALKSTGLDHGKLDALQAALIASEAGSWTPWGPSITETTYIEGVVFYETGRHGGIHLSDERNEQMPEYFRQGGGWYEEDCEAHKVLLVFAEEITAKKFEVNVEVAEAIVGDYWPEALEAWRAASR